MWIEIQSCGVEYKGAEVSGEINDVIEDLKERMCKNQFSESSKDTFTILLDDGGTLIMSHKTFCESHIIVHP